MIGIVAALLAVSVPGCSPVPGVGRLWRADVRWVVVGETHGTNESPVAFGNLVCLASATGRPVTVALEYSSDDQAAIDAYLASDGADRARSDLLKLFLFASDMQDGRGSVAFLRLWEQLREMKQTGRILGVVASDVGRTTPEGQERNAAMAQTWMRIAAPGNAVILALVGNLHAMRKPMRLGGRTITTAGSIMPARRTMTVNIDGNGGRAWNCQDDGCRPHDSGYTRHAKHGVIYSTAADRLWDASYELGVPTTAAEPANHASASPR